MRRAPAGRSTFMHAPRGAAVISRSRVRLLLFPCRRRKRDPSLALLQPRSPRSSQQGGEQVNAAANWSTCSSASGDAFRMSGRSKDVHGLCGTDAYRRLFPEAYVHSRVAMANDRRFRGMARWGQFLDREGKVKPALKEAFLRNLDQLNT